LQVSSEPVVFDKIIIFFICHIWYIFNNSTHHAIGFSNKTQRPRCVFAYIQFILRKRLIFLGVVV
jgi:hypothetical protein